MKAGNLREGHPAASPALTPAQAVEPGVIIDGDRRQLRLREPTLLEEQDTLVAMGSHADSPAALRRAFYALRVAAIDGEPIMVPRSNTLYRVMMQSVGHAGIIAVINHLTPIPEDEPVVELDGEIGDFIILPHNGGVAVFRIAAPPSEVDQAKN
jgi:hypothetical protein